MKIYSTIQIGEHHTHHCEDYLVITETGKNKLLCAVMDGCSMGTDSYFAATLTGKLLQKIANEYNYREFATQETFHLPELLENIVRQLFRELYSLKNIIRLSAEEILNTLLIAIIDTTTRKGEFLCV